MGPAPTTGLAASGHTQFDSTTPPKASSLPSDLVSQLLVDLKDDISTLRSENGKTFDLEGLLEYQRVANYLSAAQIFLRSNALLTRKLTKDDIKKRLLGHWGTCPGLNFAYAHTNYLIKSHEKDQSGTPLVLFITGPGHGAPALLSTLFMEGAITRFYPEYPMSAQGLESFVKAFSFPGGFPSHVNGETPGAIHEGGELGYALAVAYGSVMDKPDLITVVVVGDGESETGPTAAAWHAHKYIDPAESGMVLSILHVNGYKIAERTIPGTMDDLELACLYTGYGYQVRIVEYGVPSASERKSLDEAVNYDMAASMEWAYKEIRKIQTAARSGKPITKPRWPMIIMRTPKGWTGPVKLGDNALEGSWRAHQVPLPSAAADDEQLELLVKWLESYHPKELFNSDFHSSNSAAHNPSAVAGGLIDAKALRIIPSDTERRMGMVDEAYRCYKPLDLPGWEQFGKEAGEEFSAMKAVGSYIAQAIKKNPHSLRMFSPDELSSNKLDEALKVSHRNFQWDPETANSGGRVIEMLSEHTLQGFLQGYVLTGRHGVFPSYESFLGIVATMIEQYAKFLKVSLETKWRGDVSSLNYIETSTLWRQEHNGYSHQNPGLIGQLMALPRHVSRIYLPSDANTSLSCIDHVMRSKNYVNLIVGSKNPTTNWLSIEDARKHCVAGASVWEQYSTEGGVNPDVVLVGCGVEVTFEVIAAAAVLRNEGVRVRVVNIVDLLILGEVGGHPHALTEEAFTSLFTADMPVIINFHGFPKDIASLLFSRKSHVGRSRFTVLGYIEQGTTTTPWSMLRLNRASRYDIADIAIHQVAANNPGSKIAVKAHTLGSNWKHTLRLHERYTLEHGEDPEWCGSVPDVKEA